MATIVGSARTIFAPGKTPTTLKEDLITVILGTWLMAGLAVDGWAHNNLGQLETFFTPWHALFYSGFAATAAWILWISKRRARSGKMLVLAIPAGYELAVVGLGLFGVGGVADMIWHMIFGIEVNIDALMSPSHLLLFLGAVLILTSPLRAAWVRPGEVIGMKLFAPVLMSTALATGLTAFMFMYLSPFMDIDMGFREAGGMQQDGYMQYLNLRGGIAAVLLSTLILFAPVLLLLRRWRTPMFAFTAIFALVATLIQGVQAFGEPWVIGAAAFGGLATDLLVARLKPSAERPWSFRLVAALGPIALWSAYVAGVALTQGLGWQLEIWTGLIIWSGILGLGLGLLMMPPAVPGTPKEL